MRLSERLQRAFVPVDGRLTVGNVMDGVSDAGFGMLLALFSLPVALPFTPPGVPLPFAILIVMLAVQMMRRQHTPWVPARIRAREVKQGDSKFQALFVKTAQFFERFLRRRLAWLYSDRLVQWLIAPILILCAVAMPLPVANTTGGFAVAMIGLGMTEEDGLAGVIGLLAGLLTFAMLVVIVVFVARYGPDGVQMAADWVKTAIGR